MITDDGKELIAKYLLGQVPSYAAFISFGCGADPQLIDPTDPSKGYEEPPSNKQVMDFEMMRVPITSRSYLVDSYDDGAGGSIDRNVISLVGQFPFEAGMRVNEVAIWSDSTNALAQSNSRIICAFTEKENWMEMDGTDRKAIKYYNNPLSGFPAGSLDENGVIDNSDKAFACDNTNQTLLWEASDGSGGRANKGTRFLNHNIMMGNGSQIFADGKGVDLPDYSSDDELRFAFAFYNKLNPTSNTQTPSTKITIRFMKDPSFADSAATMELQDIWEQYNVANVPLGSLSYGPNFSWKEVKWIDIAVDGMGSDWYFAPDALRFDNIATLNPLYKMTGYSRIESGFLEHASGTNAYAQFRFELGAN